MNALMPLPDQIGPILGELRAAAGIKQSDVAAALGTHPSRISRIESGDMATDWKEVTKFLKFVGTDAAAKFRSVLDVPWNHVARPLYWHPQLESLVLAEGCLSRLHLFIEQPDVPRTLIGQAVLLRDSLLR